MKAVFSACPHDVVLDPEKWTAFAHYFATRTKFNFEFVRFESFDLFAHKFDQFDFVYVHSLHAVQLASEKGYLPVAKYTEVYDEAVVISRISETGSDIRKISNRSVACIPGTPSHAALLIDLHNTGNHLTFEEIPRDTYPKVQMSVSIGEADFGVILKSVWDEMLSMKERVRVHYTTASHSLVHVFMLSPKHREELDHMRQILVDMNSNSTGRDILAKLRCPSMNPFTDNDLEELKRFLLLCNYDTLKAA